MFWGLSLLESTLFQIRRSNFESCCCFIDFLPESILLSKLIQEVGLEIISQGTITKPYPFSKHQSFLIFKTDFY